MAAPQPTLASILAAPAPPSIAAPPPTTSTSTSTSTTTTTIPPISANFDPSTDHPIHALIVDAGPLISSTSTTSLLSRARSVYTTPAVIAEIRDAATRSRLETTWLPFLTQRSPKAESIRVVAEFSKKTGDYASLSVTDLQLLALTYELECEGNGGDWRLRRIPGQKGVNGPVPGKKVKAKKEEVKAKEKTEKKEEEVKPEQKEAQTPTAQTETTADKQTATHQAQAEPKADASDVPATEDNAPAAPKRKRTRRRRKAKKSVVEAGEANKEALEEEEEEEEAAEEAPIAGTEAPTKVTAVSLPAIETLSIEAEPAPQKTPEPIQETPEATQKESLAPQESTTDASDASPDSDSDNEGWITPTTLHLHSHPSTSTSASTPPKKTWPMAAALATTDYAMQNVLLQMNLHLVSPTDLHRIRSIRTWLLRCHACFKLCRDTTRQFCPTCGGATLLKTSVSTDSNGVFQVHLKRNMQWSNRGAVYSIPKTQHGSASGKGVKKNLILREDQVEYQREVKAKMRQKERDLLDPDYLPGILTGERREGGAMPRIGYGRRNPNERVGGRNKH